MIGLAIFSLGLLTAMVILDHQRRYWREQARRSDAEAKHLIHMGMAAQRQATLHENVAPLIRPMGARPHLSVIHGGDDAA